MATPATPATPRVGVHFPLQPDGAVSTTKTGKAIWRAAALAVGDAPLAAADLSSADLSLIDYPPGPLPDSRELSGTQVYSLH